MSELAYEADYRAMHGCGIDEDPPEGESLEEQEQEEVLRSVGYGDSKPNLLTSERFHEESPK